LIGAKLVRISNFCISTVLKHNLKGIFNFVYSNSNSIRNINLPLYQNQIYSIILMQ